MAREGGQVGPRDALGRRLPEGLIHRARLQGGGRRLSRSRAGTCATASHASGPAGAPSHRGRVAAVLIDGIAAYVLGKYSLLQKRHAADIGAPCAVPLCCASTMASPTPRRSCADAVRELQAGLRRHDRASRSMGCSATAPSRRCATSSAPGPADRRRGRARDLAGAARARAADLERPTRDQLCLDDPVLSRTWSPRPAMAPRSWPPRRAFGLLPAVIVGARLARSRAGAWR